MAPDKEAKGDSDLLRQAIWAELSIYLPAVNPAIMVDTAELTIEQSMERREESILSRMNQTDYPASGYRAVSDVCAVQAARYKGFSCNFLLMK